MLRTTRKPRIALAVVAVLAIVATSPASAQEVTVTSQQSQGKVETAVTAAKHKKVEATGGKGQSADGVFGAVATSSSGGNGKPAPTYTVDVFRGQPGADNACTTIVAVPVGTTLNPASGQRGGGSGGIDSLIRDHIAATGEAPAPCDPPDPTQPADPAAPAPAGPSDAELLLAAQQFVDTFVPEPGPTTEPPRNEGFVGVPVLVQLGHDHTISAPARTVTLFGTDYTLTAELTAETTVD